MADGSRTDDHGPALAEATRLHAAGDSARALELLPDLVAARPDDIEVRLLLAHCLASAGAPAVALAAAEAAVACDPGSWEAHTLVARGLVATDPERAVVAADRAVHLAPHEPDALRAQASVHAARETAAAAAEDGTSTRRGSAVFGAALGLRSAPAPAAPDPLPKLEPRLPAALDPTRIADPPAPDGSEPAPAPLAAPVVAPAPPPAAAPPTAPAPVMPPADAALEQLADDEPAATATGTTGLEPVLPASLGGTGLPGRATTTTDQPTPMRIGFRVLGLAFWLFLGFRLALQGVGGPVGAVLFLGVLAGVAWGATQLRRV